MTIDAATLHGLYRTMLTIRLFEQRVSREFRTGEIPGFVHMYIGEEAVAAGVCANLDDSDYVTSTHRGHGHCIAKGCELGPMMAEIYGREDGLCKGRGGSMHIADFSRGMLGANAIVGGGIALATGAGLASSVRGSGQVAVAFFGDGAANQGVLHESLNLAAIWKLPVLYVCENNGFAESTPAAYATSVPDVASRAVAYGIPGVVADGADVREVYAAAHAAVARARAGEGPTLLEVKTYRHYGHFEGDPDRYRDDEDRRLDARARRPRPAARRAARKRRRDGGGARRAAGRARGRRRAGRRVRPRKPVPGSLRGRALRLPRAARTGGGALMAVATERSLSLVDAVGEAMRQAMEADENVIVMGEDVVGGAGRGGEKENTMGGSFGATKSLFPLFGANRVRDTPISEAGFVGAGVGAAAAGLRPVVDAMWADFTGLAFDQIYNQAGKMSYMFGGQARLPLTIRVAMGSGLSAAAQHSGTLYAIYTHLPGIKVVVPSTPYDAKGLLLESIFDDSPVMFFEHLKLYVAKGPVPEEPYRIPLGVAEVRRAGSDVTIVAIAAMVDRALAAADVLADAGTSVEVIDPRTLSPLDVDTIVASVEKTGALVVVDESPPQCSVASEIAAVVTEQAFDYLNGPVVRVTAPHAPVPFTPSLEEAYAPSVQAIVDAVGSLG